MCAETVIADLPAEAGVASKYFEGVARMRGVSVDALRPHLARLRAFEAKASAGEPCKRSPAEALVSAAALEARQFSTVELPAVRTGVDPDR